jgi:hypothetical protein
MDEIMFNKLKESKILRSATSKIMNNEYPLENCTESFGFVKIFNLPMEDPQIHVLFAYIPHHDEPFVQFTDERNNDDDGYMIMMDLPSLYRFLRLPNLENLKTRVMMCSCHDNDLPTRQPMRKKRKV